MKYQDIDNVAKAVFMSLFIAAGHMIWLVKGGCPGEVVTGFGGSLILLGLTIVGVRMLSRRAVDEATAGAMPQGRLNFYTKATPVYINARNQMWERIRSGIISERITAASFIAPGTVLNAYGPMVARVLKLKGGC